MHFSITASLLLTALTSALPTIERRQGIGGWIMPSFSNKLYEYSPSLVYADGWGEASQVLNNHPSKVHSLVAFKLHKEDGGRTCNLRFGKPSIATGSFTLQVFSFVPNNGGIDGGAFDYKKASWGNKHGYRDQDLAIHKAGGKSNLVYSFKCPTGGKWINYEVAPVGDSNMQWPPQPAPSKEGGLWIEVVAPKTNPSTSSEPFSPVRIDSKDQVQVIEAMGSGGIGSAQWGEINRSTKGKTITTLVGFIMPETDYSTRTCNLRFTKEYASSGTKTFKLYNFTPNGGAEIFESFLVSWQDKRGKRGSQLSTYKLGENKPVWTFKCPKPGKGVDFEFVPTEEKVNIKWNSVQGKGGPWIEVV